MPSSPIHSRLPRILMSKLFPHLFSPIELRGHRLRNRIVFGAHTANMAEGGLPTERHAAYYAERAIGGAAMIVVEPMPVHPTAVLTRGNFRPCDDNTIPTPRYGADGRRDFAHGNGSRIRCPYGGSSSPSDGVRSACSWQREAPKSPGGMGEHRDRSRSSGFDPWFRFVICRSSDG